MAYKDPEKTREYYREYRIKNRERLKELNQKWFAENKDHRREYSRRYQQENKEKIYLQRKNKRINENNNTDDTN